MGYYGDYPRFPEATDKWCARCCQDRPKRKVVLAESDYQLCIPCVKETYMVIEKHPEVEEE